MSQAQALIVYGDGLQALFYEDKNPEPDRNGILVQPHLVVPSEEIKSKYNLTDEDLPIITDDNKKGIWMNYPVKQIDWLNRSKTGAVIFVWCSFDGSFTPIMRKMDELLEWDTQRDKTESRLKAQVSSLQRELEDVTGAKKEFFRKQKEIADIYGNKDNNEED